MKTISDAAMAAIEAGEAIVTGAVVIRGTVFEAPPDPPAPGTFLFGQNGTPGASIGLAPGDIQVGSAFVCPYDAVVGNIVIRGSGAFDNPTLNWRLCIYNATSNTVWSGALLGQTADQVGLALDTVVSVPLITPVPVIGGQYYALTIHTGTGATISTRGVDIPTITDRWFTDTYSDGPIDPAPASSFNSPNGRIIYATT